MITKMWTINLNGYWHDNYKLLKQKKDEKI